MVQVTTMVSYEFFIFICACLGVCVSVSGNIITPCKITDKACILSSAKSALPKIVAGIPELGVPSSDPLHVDFINGDLSILKFTFKDITVRGFQNCDVQDIDLNINENTLKLELLCPNFQQSGEYTISGRLIILPVEGAGTHTINSELFKLTINAEIQKIQGKDGVEHLVIKNFKTKIDPLKQSVFDFKNLFNGQKDLSDAVHKFANENYKEVSEFTFEPVFSAILKLIFKNVNKYLKTVPVEELFLA